MRRLKFLVLAIICSAALGGCVVTSETVHVRSRNVYDPYGYTPYYAPAPVYGAPAYGYGQSRYARPRYSGPQPVYATPRGVARPERFACGADVYTGAYNCVPRRKAHFVRPQGYTHGSPW